MAATLEHRGPDAGGVWVDDRVGLALGHRRLSIIDLSAAGAQPMHSASGRYSLTFNGEIYNFQRLRKEFDDGSYPFRGHSDSEVILAVVERLGINEAIRKIQGMFAFAIWDRETRELILVRDRTGKKPLYYGWFRSTFLFGSELKALRRHPEFENDIDLNVLGQYLQFGWVSAPGSIHKKLRQLPAGHMLRITQGSKPHERQPEAFWSACEILEMGQADQFKGSFGQAVDELDRVLCATVQDRMVADVDIGALLSGGVDSSMVVALMQNMSDRPVKTFSIGFWEEKYNEAQFAASVAKALGTEHHELYVTPEQALAVVDHLPEIYDEPFADASQIPTFLISKLAREHVKVVLTGDGGDEQFAGYRHYKHCLESWQSVNRVPVALRRAFASLTRSLSDRTWKLVSQGDFETTKRIPNWLRKLGKYGQRSCNWMSTRPEDVLTNRFTKCLSVDRFVNGAVPSVNTLTDCRLWAVDQDPLFSMLYYDYIGYLADDILVKVDRASMAVGLEARSPLLDQRVLRFAWSMPRDYLFDGNNGKLVLKELLYRYVPRELIDRPKRGFNVPVKEWLVGPLRHWVEDLISDEMLKRQGIFDESAVRKAWAQHRRGWVNQSELIWAILMFQVWYETWMKSTNRLPHFRGGCE
jgi:asparagine synthase (glutamine-hydrolysing)